MEEWWIDVQLDGDSGQSCIIQHWRLGWFHRGAFTQQCGPFKLDFRVFFNIFIIPFVDYCSEFVLRHGGYGTQLTRTF